MSYKIKYSEIPYPDGRFNLYQSEFVSLLLEAIELFRISSQTPKGKRIMIPTNLLAHHVAYGTMKTNVLLCTEKDHKKIGFLKRKISNILMLKGAIKSGNCVVIEPEVIKKLQGDST